MLFVVPVADRQLGSQMNKTAYKSILNDRALHRQGHTKGEETFAAMLQLSRDQENAKQGHRKMPRCTQETGKHL